MSQILEIRPFRPSDDPTCTDIRRRAVLAVSPRFYSRHARETWAEEVAPGSDTRMAAMGVEILVAEGCSGALSGFAGYRVAGAKARLIRLYVDPNAQGLGIGTRLLAEAELGMARRGAILVVLEASLSALAFYEARGYQVTARARHSFDNGVEMDIRHMEKTL